MKAFLIPFAILASAYGFAKWIIGWFGGKEEPREEFADCFGWFSPQMQPHWDRLFSDWRVLHNLKNLTTEWTRLSAQRASKTWAFVTVVGWVGLCLVLVL